MWMQVVEKEASAGLKIELKRATTLVDFLAINIILGVWRDCAYYAINFIFVFKSSFHLFSVVLK